MKHRGLNTADFETALARLGRTARAELTGEVSPDQTSRARWCFRESLAKEMSGKRGSRWSLGAGPFAIAVTGTAFDVGWSGADQVFEVTLRSGSITVKGPMAASGIQLAAGERLVANLKAGQLRVDRPAPAASAVPNG